MILTARVSIPAGAKPRPPPRNCSSTRSAFAPTCAPTHCCSARSPRSCCTPGLRPGRATPDRRHRSRSWCSSVRRSLVQPDSRWMYSWGFTTGGHRVRGALHRGARRGVAASDTCCGRGPAAWLGRMSYALYLWHLPVFVVIGVDAPDMPVGVALVARVGHHVRVRARCRTTSSRLPVLRLKGRLSERAHGPEHWPRRWRLKQRPVERERGGTHRRGVCSRAQSRCPRSSAASSRSWRLGADDRQPDHRGASYDVFTAHPPLVGIYHALTTIAHSPDGLHHLGPLEFWLLALPVRLGGPECVGLVVRGIGAQRRRGGRRRLRRARGSAAFASRRSAASALRFSPGRSAARCSTTRGIRTSPSSRSCSSW